jgi:5-methylcytosine-specific restriction endonuclease McrA
MSLPEPTSREEALELGLHLYSSSKPCAYGHIGTRHVKRGCLQCRADIDRQKRDPNFKRVRVFEPNDPGTAAAHGANYRTAKIQRLARWASLAEIKRIYGEARRLGLVVDHVIPLKGRLVCGLHVENNLQLLTHEENSRKGNRFNPEDFETTLAPSGTSQHSSTPATESPMPKIDAESEGAYVGARIDLPLDVFEGLRALATQSLSAPAREYNRVIWHL